MTTDDSDGQLTDALVRAAFTTMAVLSTVAADNDLSLTQLRLLAILRDRRPRMADLATHLGLERSTMSGLVERAERRGLVRRTPSAGDGRVVEVALTQQGTDLAARLARSVAEQLDPLTAHLGTRDRRALRTLLGRMAGPS